MTGVQQVEAAARGDHGPACRPDLAGQLRGVLVWPRALPAPAAFPVPAPFRVPARGAKVTVVVLVGDPYDPAPPAAR